MNASTIPEQSDDYGIVLAGHGSRDPDGVRQFEELVGVVRQRAMGRRVDHGFLEFAAPTINQAVKSSIAAGSTRVVVVPALLAAASHAKNDMPGELHLLRRQFPDTDLHFGAVMELHPLLLRLCQQRIIEVEATSNKSLSRSQTCLVVVGRGTSDPDANAEIAKLTRMLQEGMGFAASVVCYAGTAKPSVADGLKQALRLGHKRLIVLPYLMFDGILVKRIYAAADATGKRAPSAEILKADYLGVHSDVADVFLERAKEGIEGRAHMNCSLCKYRVEIVGFESQVGMSQMKVDSFALPLKSDKESDVAVAKKYQPHPIESESFSIIESGRDWSDFPQAERSIAQRLVHTTGDFGVVDELFFSPGAVEAGIRAVLRCRQIVTDVTMVLSGINRSLEKQLKLITWCGVHDRETELLASASGQTRSAIGIRRAYELFGNDVILAIGDAPTALLEALRLVKDKGWRPQLVIGLPVGFVGTQRSKDELRSCLHVPRITNSGTKGGSGWAAAVVNGLMIGSVNRLAEV
jgi:precorrin-8X/cobalt-precorrin-8 methylmutase